MKKILALVLAGVMTLATGVVAFAAAPTDSAIDSSKGQFAFDTTYTEIFGENTLELAIWTGTGGGWKAANDDDLEDYKLSVKITEGKDLVKSAKLDDIVAATGGNMGLVVKYDDYYDVSKATIKFEVKLLNKNGRTVASETISFKINNTGNKVNARTGLIGGAGDRVSGIKYASGDISISYPDFDNNVVDFDDGQFLELEAPYFGYSVKLSDQSDQPMAFSSKVNKSVARLAPADAELTFIDFPGRPSFDFTGTATFVLPDEDKEYYIYSINDDNELTEINAKLNDDDDALTFKTRTLGSYVMSDIELDTANVDDADEEEIPELPTGGEEVGGGTGGNTGGTVPKPNPGTGSSDFVGVAVALAVVSVAAAGAVALKRK